MPRPLLCVAEFHGTAAAVAQQAEAVRELSLEFGGTGFASAETQEERDQVRATTGVM
jgi:hypothetical protein